MRAMILAAGRGERMGKLTDNTPKALLRVGDHYLIEYAINHLVGAGFTEIIINVSYQAEQIKSALGDGKRYGASIHYSEEKERLETGGGIFQALPLLGHEPFLVIGGDIITDFPLASVPREPKGLTHLIMVNNPSYHPQGDFGLRDGKLEMNAPALTFASIGVYRPELFTDCEPGHFRLTKLLVPAILKGQVTGEHYQGSWYNIGTPEDLEDISRSC